MDDENSTKTADLSLQDYVKEVCLQILKGVVDAQSDDDLGKYIGRAPVNAEHMDEGSNSITLVDFDVSTEASVSMDGKGRVNVATIISADGKMEKKRVDANRIKFSIPVAIPAPSDQIYLRSRLNRERQADIDERNRRNRQSSPVVRNR